MLDIQPTTGVTRVSAAMHESGGLRLTRFFEDGVATPAAILVVTWEQTPGLAPKGVVLQLEYRMDGERRIHTLRQPLPERARGPQTARFEIPITAEGGNRVAAWRLRILAGDRILDEAQSAAWR